MTFVIVAIFIVAAVAAPILAALFRPVPDGMSDGASDQVVYRDQLKEIDRDLERGVLSDTEAEAVRTEVSRRLLEADARAQTSRKSSTGQRGLAAVVVVAALVFGGFGLYSTLGAPGVSDLPMKQRLAAIEKALADRISQSSAENLAAAELPKAPDADPKFLELMEKLRAALKERPNDVTGLGLLAEYEARLGNFASARAAQEGLLEAKVKIGEAVLPDDLVMLIDMMVFSAGGYVSPEAEDYLHQLVEADPENGAGQYYAGLLLAQTGRPDRAFPIWRQLLETSAPSDPWVPVIRAEISAIAEAAGVDYQLPRLAPGPSADDIANAEAMTDAQRNEMIRGMVDGLSERLATEGGPPKDWARLITALGVLGDLDQARAIVDEARDVFSANDVGLQVINAAARQAGVEQ